MDTHTLLEETPKPKASASRLKMMGTGRSDNFQTPDWPVISLLNALPEPLDGVVWEPACGKGNIVNLLERTNQAVFGTDILTGFDFLTECYDLDMEPFDYIITNPPFSKKDEFLTRCYELGKPFALLLPFTALEGKYRQSLYKKYGLQVLVLPKRPDFEYPDGNFKRKPWFPCAWFTNGFNFDKDLIFLEG